MTTNGNGTSIKDILKSALKEDGGFYLAVVTLLGYLLTMVQQIVRYAYYGVELTYLLNIKLEDILLGIFYVIILFLFFVLPFELASRASNKIVFILKQAAFWLICCAFAYALTLRWAIDFFLLFLFVIVFSDGLVVFLLNKFSHRIRNWLERTSALSKVTLAFITLISLIIVLQFFIEFYNKRFTYISDECKYYSVLTTYQDCYITIESKIQEDEITILRGNIKLIPISGSEITEKQFSSKIME